MCYIRKFAILIRSPQNFVMLFYCTCCCGNYIKIIGMLRSYQCTTGVVSGTPWDRSASPRHRSFNGISGNFAVCDCGVVNTSRARWSILLLQTKHTVCTALLHATLRDIMGAPTDHYCHMCPMSTPVFLP